MKLRGACVVSWLAIACSDAKPAETESSRPVAQVLAEFATRADYDVDRLVADHPGLHPDLLEALRKRPLERTQEDQDWIASQLVLLNPYRRSARATGVLTLHADQRAAVDPEIETLLAEIRALDEPQLELALTPPAHLASKGSGLPIVSGIETRDHQVWFHYGTEEQLYTVKTKDGVALASEIDDATLLLYFPALHEKVHEGVDALGFGPDAIGY